MVLATLGAISNIYGNICPVNHVKYHQQNIFQRLNMGIGCYLIQRSLCPMTNDFESSICAGVSAYILHVVRSFTSHIQ